MQSPGELFDILLRDHLRPDNTFLSVDIVNDDRWGWGEHELYYKVKRMKDERLIFTDTYLEVSVCKDCKLKLNDSGYCPQCGIQKVTMNYVDAGGFKKFHTNVYHEGIGWLYQLSLIGIVHIEKGLSIYDDVTFPDDEKTFDIVLGYANDLRSFIERDYFFGVELDDYLPRNLTWGYNETSMILWYLAQAGILQRTKGISVCTRCYNERKHAKQCEHCGAEYAQHNSYSRYNRTQLGYAYFPNTVPKPPYPMAKGKHYIAARNHLKERPPLHAYCVFCSSNNVIITECPNPSFIRTTCADCKQSIAVTWGRFIIHEGNYF